MSSLTLHTLCLFSQQPCSGMVHAPVRVALVVGVVRCQVSEEVREEARAPDGPHHLSARGVDADPVAGPQVAVGKEAGTVQGLGNSLKS